MSNNTALDFTLAYYWGNRKVGGLALVQRRAGSVEVRQLPREPQSTLPAQLKPILLGLTAAGQAVLLDPQSKIIRVQSSFPEDAFAAHLYADPNSSRDWFMNDGDKDSGNDRLNCGDKGSSVTVVDKSGSAQASYLRTICVGRGHHQATFAQHMGQGAQVPARAYVSSLNDGTISVIGNDPDDAATYLQVVATIDLCEPDREKDSNAPTVPNTAYPHGIAFSPATGKLYNLNNGYGTIAVIDAASHEIEERIAFKGHSNLFAVPGGRFLIGRGADRKSDPLHVIAKLTVFDPLTKNVCDKIELRDIYLGKYFFNPEGTRLYFTTSTSGSPEQQQNIKADLLLVFDLTALPELKLVAQVPLGASAGTVAFAGQGGVTRMVFASCTEQGAVALLDGVSNDVVGKIQVAESAVHSRLWAIE
jgi:hypothetical protein